jgi:hypothetical protein
MSAFPTDRNDWETRHRPGPSLWGVRTMAGTATANATTDILNERQLLAALRAVRKGDFTARLPSDLTGFAG